LFFGLSLCVSFLRAGSVAESIAGAERCEPMPLFRLSAPGCGLTPRAADLLERYLSRTYLRNRDARRSGSMQGRTGYANQEAAGPLPAEPLPVKPAPAASASAMAFGYAAAREPPRPPASSRSASFTSMRSEPRFPQSVIIDDFSLPTFDDPRLTVSRALCCRITRLAGSGWDKLNRGQSCPH
jgi:hypothetical protein